MSDSLQSNGVSLPHSSVQGILQARMVDWVAMSTSKGIFPTEGLNSCLLGFLLWQMGSLSLTPQNICYNKQMVTIFTRITISSSKLTHKQAALDTTVHFKMSDTNFQKKKLKLFFLMFYVAFYNWIQNILLKKKSSHMETIAAFLHYSLWEWTTNPKEWIVGGMVP